MRVRLANGEVVEVGNDALYNDDDTPFSVPTGRIFTEDDVARIRQEEKSKLHNQMERNNTELTALREQVGTLTAAQQAEQQRLEQEQARLAAEARKAEEAELDAKTLVERRTQEWEQQLNEREQTWSQRLEEERQARLAAEALTAREREFSELKDYIQAQVTAHQNDIAPQLIQWIGGNTRDEVDANVARAIDTTNAILTELQQVAPPNQEFNQTPGQAPVPPTGLPPLPGTRATAGPANTDPATNYQTLTAEQIRTMPMDQFAKLRGTLGIGGQSRSQGMFG